MNTLRCEKGGPPRGGMREGLGAVSLPQESIPSFVSHSGKLSNLRRVLRESLIYSQGQRYGRWDMWLVSEVWVVFVGLVFNLWDLMLHQTVPELN